MILETTRLLLREYVADDWIHVHQYASDADLVKFMDWGPNTESDTRDFIQLMLEQQKDRHRKTFGLAIIAKESESFIGGCELAVKDHAQANVGYTLNRHQWGNGYATEAARALCRFGFDALQLHRIYATCRPENIASQKVMQKLGMKLEGHLREHFFAKGQWQDSLLYSMLYREFAP